VDKKAPDAKVESLVRRHPRSNGLRQAGFCTGCSVERRRFNQLDGTAKGGVVLAVVKQMGLPIRFIGAELKTSALFQLRIRRSHS